MQRIARRLDRLQARHTGLQLTVAVLRKFTDDQAGGLAAVLAYYGFLAIFPLLLVLVTVLGIVLRNDPDAQQRVLHSALIDFPIIGDQLRGNVHSLNRTGIGLVVGLAGTLFGARGLAMATQNAFNRVWAVPYLRSPSFLSRQLRGLGLLAVIGTAVGTTGALSRIAQIGSWRGWAVEGSALIVSSALNAALFVAGFRIATAREVPTRRFARAACVAAVGWQLLLITAGWLVARELRHAEQVYGLFGLVLGLLVWLRVQAQLTLLALEADVVRAKGLWPRALAADAFEHGDARAYTAYVLAQQRRPELIVTVTLPADNTASQTKQQPPPPSQAAYTAVLGAAGRDDSRAS